MFFGIDLAHMIEVLGYPGIFAIVLAESGLFFAVSLPGGSLLFTAGLLASQGYLNLPILISVVVVAAILGDTIGYVFGSWVGPALYRRPDSRFFKRKHLEHTRTFFEAHGSKTILLARFIPIVRTFAPILAGIAQMNYRVFFIYNALGAIIWGGGFVIGGYLLGETVPGIEQYLEIFILGIVVVTTMPFFWHLYRHGVPQSATLPTAVIFDLDDTLAESFTPPSERILEKLSRLSRKTTVAIMSGADFDRMKRDIITRLPNPSLFYIFSDNASHCHVYREGAWEEAYSFPLQDAEKVRIQDALRDAIAETAVYDGPVTARFVDHGRSFALAALPKNATQDEKRAWDPDGTKRHMLAASIREKLPDFHILISGKSTIDVVRAGISKAYGVEWLANELATTPASMLFIGDGFYAGGNDAIVIPTGIQTRVTHGPNETEEYIDSLL